MPRDLPAYLSSILNPRPHCVLLCSACVIRTPATSAMELASSRASNRPAGWLTSSTADRLTSSPTRRLEIADGGQLIMEAGLKVHRAARLHQLALCSLPSSLRMSTRVVLCFSVCKWRVQRVMLCRGHSRFGIEPVV